MESDLSRIHTKRQRRRSQRMHTFQLNRSDRVTLAMTLENRSLDPFQASKLTSTLTLILTLGVNRPLYFLLLAMRTIIYISSLGLFTLCAYVTDLRLRPRVTTVNGLYSHLLRLYMGHSIKERSIHGKLFVV